TELRKAVTISAVAEIMASEEELSDLEEVFDGIEHVQDLLLINKIVDLSQYDSENEIISTRYDTGNMEYSPEQLVDEFLVEELAL
ncbi:16189_t:CDS:1, partial [Cetraspora pellucida]